MLKRGSRLREKSERASSPHGLSGIGERSDAVLRTAMPGNDEEASNERTKKDAERRQTQVIAVRTQTACGTRHGKAACAALRLRARLPVGVPPRLLPKGVSHPQGAARARLRGCAAIRGGHAASAATTSSDAPRTPVLVPAGLMPEPPGSGSQIRPRATPSPQWPGMPPG